jgi:hypothetical protein
MPTSTYYDLLQQACGELNVVALGDQLSSNVNLQQRMLDRLVMMVGSWNLKPTIVPWYEQHIFNLVPGQQAYLIGLNAPDWNAPRPVKLHPEATNLLLINPVSTGPSAGNVYQVDQVQTNSFTMGAPPYSFSRNGTTLASYPVGLQINFRGPGQSPGGTQTTAAATRIPLAVLKTEQWANISLPSLENTYPSGCYYDRSVVTGTNSSSGLAYVAGTISVWGIPTVVNQIEFFYWHALTVGNLTDTVNAGPGYFRAMALNLAVEVAPMFGITVNAITLRNAIDALADIKEQSAPDTTMVPDAGMPASPTSGWITRAQFLSGQF